AWGRKVGVRSLSVSVDAGAGPGGRQLLKPAVQVADPPGPEGAADPDGGRHLARGHQPVPGAAGDAGVLPRLARQLRVDGPGVGLVGGRPCGHAGGPRPWLGALPGLTGRRVSFRPSPRRPAANRPASRVSEGACGPSQAGAVYLPQATPRLGVD